MNTKEQALEFLADYIVNNDINYCGGEFERSDGGESFMVVVSKETAMKNLTETNEKQADRIKELEAMHIDTICKEDLVTLLSVGFRHAEIKGSFQTSDLYDAFGMMVSRRKNQLRETK